MGQVISFEVPGVPPSLNQFAGRENSWEYRGLKAQWTNTVRMLGRPHRPPEPFEKAIVILLYRFPDRRRRDPDNYAGKMILDGLTKAGIIADDSFQRITLVLKAEAKPGKPRVTISVQEE